MLEIDMEQKKITLNSEGELGPVFNFKVERDGETTMVQVTPHSKLTVVITKGDVSK